MEAAVWSTIELYAGIVTASLPAVHKLFSLMGLSPAWARVKNRLTGASSSRSGGGSGTSGASSTNKSGLSSAADKPKGRQLSLMRGDGSDFIPLTDVESGKGHWDQK